MNPSPLPVPSLSTLREVVLGYAIPDSRHPAVRGGWQWDVNNYFGESSMETISTAQVEAFLLRTGGVPAGSLLAQRSPALVKSADDQAFYAAQGYPAPPLGSTIRGIGLDGTLGGGNYLEIMPAVWYVDSLIRVGDIANATKAANWLQSTLFQASFYGVPVTLGYAVYNASGGSWVPAPDTILVRNVAAVGWALYRAFQATGDPVYRESARSLVNTLALCLNNVEARIARGEIAPEASGLLYQAFAYRYFSDDVGPSYTLTWNRFTIEGLWMAALALEAAAQVEGLNTTAYDPEGTPWTARTLLQLLGAAVDRYPTMSWRMRDTWPGAPHMPYQFVIQQAWAPYREYLKGVNFDWTEESGTRFGPTWWVGDLELWGINGMLALKRMGYASSAVEEYLWDWLRLPGPSAYVWHDRYQINGEPLRHDLSAPITFTALYGMALFQGFQPAKPTPPISVVRSGNGWVVNAPGASRILVYDTSGALISSATGSSITIPFAAQPLVVVKEV